MNKKVMMVGCLMVLASGCAHGGGMYRFPELNTGERYIIQRDRAEAVLEAPRAHHPADQRRMERSRGRDAEWVK
jgi:hypothetical protein